jgi:hypothetical protein
LIRGDLECDFIGLRIHIELPLEYRSSIIFGGISIAEVPFGLYDCSVADSSRCACIEEKSYFSECRTDLQGIEIADIDSVYKQYDIAKTRLDLDIFGYRYRRDIGFSFFVSAF